ncbi:MAG: anti-sigma factor [Alphaproteobacteria bacterium]|nr:MAG: anti-sigma factor [Alphaproteobacteria bacterium]
MSDAWRDISEDDLNRFVDGRLVPERRARVAAYLAAHADQAQEAAAFARLNARLRKAFDAVSDEPIPPALVQAAIRGRTCPRRHWRRLGRAAALVIAVAGLGIAGGWQLREAVNGPASWSEFAREAAAAHRVFAPDRQFPVELPATRKAQLVAWLSARIGAPITTPNLEKVGFRLIGGRLVPTPDGPAAQLMYENGSGTRITLYLRADLRNSRDIKFRIARENEVNVWYWLDGPRGYALSGDIDQQQLLRIAEVLYDEVGS